ncbi:MAG: hypothetical protein ACUZ8H_11395 [Candidatus Anammoxibacter sp.]
MELYYERDYGTDIVKIWLRDKRGDQVVYYGYDGEYLVEQVKKAGCGAVNNSKPFLILPFFFAERFIKTITEYGNKNGHNIESQNKTEGKLEATKLHLKDLQAITNKLLKIK